MEFTVTFASKASKVGLGQLTQELRLDLKPGPPVAIIIKANVTVPELKLSTEAIDFGDVVVGRCYTYTVLMHNPKEVVADWACKPPLEGAKDFALFGLAELGHARAERAHVCGGHLRARRRAAVRRAPQLQVHRQQQAERPRSRRPRARAQGGVHARRRRAAAGDAARRADDGRLRAAQPDELPDRGLLGRVRRGVRSEEAIDPRGHVGAHAARGAAPALRTPGTGFGEVWGDVAEAARGAQGGGGRRRRRRQGGAPRARPRRPARSLSSEEEEAPAEADAEGGVGDLKEAEGGDEEAEEPIVVAPSSPAPPLAGTAPAPASCRTASRCPSSSSRASSPLRRRRPRRRRARRARRSGGGRGRGGDEDAAAEAAAEPVDEPITLDEEAVAAADAPRRSSREAQRTAA